MSTKTNYKKLNQNATHEWVKDLKRDGKIKGTVNVRSLLQAVFDNDHDQFVAHVEETIAAKSSNNRTYNGEDQLPSLESVIELSAGSVKQMPAADIIKFYNHLSDLPLSATADPYFWGAFTLAEIKAKRVEPIWLTHHDASSRNNREIDKWINVLAKNKSHDADSLMRRVIRSLVAPGLFRFGSPELYSDCSFARHWWCGYIAQQCFAILKHPPHLKIVKILVNNWRPYAENLASRRTVIREQQIIAALVNWAFVRESKKMNIVDATVTQAINKVSALSSSHMLCFYEAKEISKLILAE